MAKTFNECRSIEDCNAWMATDCQRKAAITQWNVMTYHPNITRETITALANRSRNSYADARFYMGINDTTDQFFA